MIQERKPSIRAKEKVSIFHFIYWIIIYFLFIYLLIKKTIQITKQPEESKTLKRSKSKKMSSMDDFLLIRVLGKGNFGKVFFSFLFSSFLFLQSIDSFI